ncbi:MAG: hypothetical protein HYU73_19865 [Betaproteobacteria bacterium]|nr:hypothetical protein [Betaproteobacteria bacterium]
MCRYIARPAIANERLSVNCPGQVVLKPAVCVTRSTD